MVRHLHLAVASSLLTLTVMAGPAPLNAVKANQGFGRVKMEGAILDTPCAIDVDSRYQTVVMGSIPVNQLLREGVGPAHPFHIRLVNCTLTPQAAGKPDWSHFQVTFDGPRTHNNLFGLSGDARGVGLQITDAQGRIGAPGQPMTDGVLTEGNQQLDYVLRLAGNHETPRPGDYRTTIRFKVAYY